MKNSRQRLFRAVTALGTLSALGGDAQAQLLLYDPFDYTAGQNLGGTDPDGAGPTAGTPIGQTNTYTGGGTWYARGTTSNYQSPNDTVVSAGSLSYPGLAASIGNSVSYGSATGNGVLYANAIDIPGLDVTSGSLYASFMVRIKSTVVGTTGTTFRHSPLSFVTDTTNAGNAGAALGASSGSPTPTPGTFWMRRDPIDGSLQTTNFSPGKSNTDGIGPGATGPSAGWQHSTLAPEPNQFGDVNGQPIADFNNPSSYQTYFVVMKYEFDAMASTDGQVDTVSLWMNPGSGTLGSATGEADASQAPTGNLGSYYGAVDAFGTATVDSALISSFALFGHRQNTTNTMAVDVDELRIGTTWADVTPAAPAAQSYYWDIDGAAPGAGGTAPAGNWDGVTQNFNTDSAGGAGTLSAAPAAADTVVFAAGAGATGSYTVTVSGTRSAAQVDVEEGNVTLSGGTLAVSAFDVSAGATGTVTSTIAAPASSLTKSGVGTLQVSKLPQAHSVNVNAGTVRILESSPGVSSGHPSGDNAFVSQPSSLTVAAGAQLDITNNDVIIDYTGATPIAAYEALVASGYNMTGDWQGDGIVSSVAANDGNYVVAIADNATLAAPFGTAQGGPLFAGVDVDLDTILIKFTHRADINLDGLITPDDSAIFGGNYDENQPAVWATGDMNYDGIFTPDDAAIFGGAYDESLTSLPEPASLCLLGIFALVRRPTCVRRNLRALLDRP